MPLELATEVIEFTATAWDGEDEEVVDDEETGDEEDTDNEEVEEEEETSAEDNY